MAHVIEELIVREFVRLQLNDVKHVCLGLIRAGKICSVVAPIQLFPAYLVRLWMAGHMVHLVRLWMTGHEKRVLVHF